MVRDRGDARRVQAGRPAQVRLEDLGVGALRGRRFRRTLRSTDFVDRPLAFRRSVGPPGPTGTPHHLCDVAPDGDRARPDRDAESAPTGRTFDQASPAEPFATAGQSAPRSRARCGAHLGARSGAKDGAQPSRSGIGGGGQTSPLRCIQARENQPGRIGSQNVITRKPRTAATAGPLARPKPVKPAISAASRAPRPPGVGASVAMATATRYAVPIWANVMPPPNACTEQAIAVTYDRLIPVDPPNRATIRTGRWNSDAIWLPPVRRAPSTGRTNLVLTGPIARTAPSSASRIASTSSTVEPAGNEMPPSPTSPSPRPDQTMKPVSSTACMANPARPSIVTEAAASAGRRPSRWRNRALRAYPPAPAGPTSVAKDDADCARRFAANGIGWMMAPWNEIAAKR